MCLFRLASTWFAGTLFLFPAHAQVFQNGGLEGIDSTSSLVPAGWQAIPHTDMVCNASYYWCATPDLTSADGPVVSAGIMGNPHSGMTFVSGLSCTTSPTDRWHEGIMQNVPGFIPGETYTIYFWQAVVKQNNCLDNSGSWAIYVDSTLAGISQPTFSAAPYNSLSFPWEQRSVTFTATAASHTVKFLTEDDDANQDTSYSNTGGGLRMGIDDIQVFEGTVGFRDDLLPGAVLVYPNPGTGNFVIDTRGIKTAENSSVEVFDVTGRVVLTVPAEPGPTLRVDLAGNEKGIYFIRVWLADGQCRVVRVEKE
jgi:hypothetical protein